MFFTGDPSSRRKVDLGGRSNKEEDRLKHVERVRQEREQRQRLRQRTLSAIRIQKYYRGRKAVAIQRLVVRHDFCQTFGEYGERADRNAFKPASKYLTELLFFHRPSQHSDFLCLVSACRLLLMCVHEAGSVQDVFMEGSPPSSWTVIQHRVKRLAYLCTQALHHYIEPLKAGLLLPAGKQGPVLSPGAILLETVLTLVRNDAPWAGLVIDYLIQRRLFHLIRGVLLNLQQHNEAQPKSSSYIEQAILALVSCYLERLRTTESSSAECYLATHIMTIPLLWQHFPVLKQACVNNGLWAFSVHQLASSLPQRLLVLPPDTSPQFPSSICLLGNLVEVAAAVISQADCNVELATEFTVVARFLMEELAPYNMRPLAEDREEDLDDHMESGAAAEVKATVPEPLLEQQLRHAADFELLRHLVRVVFTDSGKERGLFQQVTPVEAGAVGALCAYLFSILMILPKTPIVIGLAYNANLVPQVWQYMKRCHTSRLWPPLVLWGRNSSENQLPADLMGWMLPLAVFCPVYSYLLTSIDNEEFYDQQRPIALDDLAQLVAILKEWLWQLLWVLPSKPSFSITPKFSKSGSNRCGIFSFHFMRQNVSAEAARLLAELHDRNSRRQFTDPQTFHARETVDENFFVQALSENTRARDLLRQAPFLVPFTDRVRIYTSQLSAARQQSSPRTAFSRVRVKIRRDHIIEDAFAQLNTLPEEALRGTIQVTFVNELGVEEAGVDGGGLFKDFMENITKPAFDIQYGLFKETSDHLLYPNPASHMAYEDHLQYFEFLGKILGKAMFEGILVDIPFATFFLSKLRNKYNYMHDLPSLDPELYRSLLFLKDYQGDLQQLGLYFIVANNEYGEQDEVELIPGGKDTPVTNANVIKYIHYVANHRLNSQIRPQSSHFLMGFQLLIKTEWIDMFNEHELQILISGSHEGMDINDLRSNVHYANGYHEDHPVIEMFWEVVKTLDADLQQKFLKFVTGCSRGPLLGFKYLEPQFCIQRAAGDEDSDETLDRLPTSATCMNLLKLPPYRSKEIIQEKLLYAITAGAGFDLS